MKNGKELKRLFSNKKALVIGGLGFIGSNIAHALVGLGARVTIFSHSKKKIHNLKGIEKKVKIIIGNITNFSSVGRIMKGKDYIFNCAAQVSYLDSIRNPVLDLETNCHGQLNILEAVRKNCPKAKILFTSSRLVYGKVTTPIVSENHPTNPVSIYAAHKLVAEKYHVLYHKIHGLNTVIARIPNPYGPRQQINNMKSGAIVGWIMKELMDGEQVKIFGSGKQKRNYLFIDDLVNILLLLITDKNANRGEIFNVGTTETNTFNEMVKKVFKAVRRGSYAHIPWPKDFEKNETGDYVPDLKKVRSFTGYRVYTPLAEGVKKMIEFYKNNKKYYW
ncbi:MAG: hypothetical protein COY66_00240 [Candidatus Kerfeldbacteria bacterium CG_4_10_14_0_8_um_filter_42_10]|uniref:NAD-dependent epimerase/dehydratase domain-containing protein n=1 Tax=Candidatus Kerfeldbacteria bacterium CG_4_10_14_0_8_um_filter_42_10 TaxID=2014248 RepID=A0A2M7RL49_9BACT|nr:MAG: hypothetical protein COY66_00240 [Candidatus Kerfeldbacteria bacterium CG_4_10_14_0_8_um_filter_42_10]